jgi:hypothetical protein
MSAISEKLVKKAIKLISDSTNIEYSELKQLCKKVLREAKNTDERLLGTMEELLDLGDCGSEEELAEFDVDVLKIYCKIKELDYNVSEKQLRKNVWANIESEFDLDDSDEDSGEDSGDEVESDPEPEPEPVVIKKKKSKAPEKPEVVVNDS